MFMPAAARPNEPERYSTIARSPSSHLNRSLTRERVKHHAAPVELRFHANHDLAFRPGGAEIWRQDEMERNRRRPRFVPARRSGQRGATSMDAGGIDAATAGAR